MNRIGQGRTFIVPVADHQGQPLRFQFQSPTGRLQTELRQGGSIQLPGGRQPVVVLKKLQAQLGRPVETPVDDALVISHGLQFFLSLGHNGFRLDLVGARGAAENDQTGDQQDTNAPLHGSTSLPLFKP